MSVCLCVALLLTAAERFTGSQQVWMDTEAPEYAICEACMEDEHAHNLSVYGLDHMYAGGHRLVGVVVRAVRLYPTPPLFIYSLPCTRAHDYGQAASGGVHVLQGNEQPRHRHDWYRRRKPARGAH